MTVAVTVPPKAMPRPKKARQKHGIVSMESINLRTSFMESFYFCWTGSDITIREFEGQGDMANMSSYLSVLLQHCCIDVNL